MRFIQITQALKRGCSPDPCLVAIDDISSIKPYRKDEVNTIISLKSAPEFAIWAHETFAEVSMLLENAGATLTKVQ